MIRPLTASVLVCLLAFSACVGAQQQLEEKMVVISPTYPKDSLGETVYDEKEDSQQGTPTVPGVLTSPKLVKDAKVKIPVSSRVHHRKLNILVQGVVTAKGDVIDVAVVREDEDSALAKNVAQAFGQCKFKSGTLNGKPVAVFITREYRYNIF